MCLSAIFIAALAAALGRSEFSSSVWVKFDELPCPDAGITAPYRLSADCDGRWTVTFRGARTELLGDYAARTRGRFTVGTWHHLEVSYSLMRKRVAVYVDGDFQFENDQTLLPVLTDDAASCSASKGCSVRDFAVYGHAKDLDELALSPDGVRTIREFSREKEETEKSAYFAARCPAGASAALFAVKPYSAEVFTPTSLPKGVEPGGTMRVFGACDQSVAGSVLVVALKAPLTIAGVTVGPLKTAGGDVFPAGATDVRIVKRWYRNGGAWLAYQGDRRQRMLVEDMLVYDDSILRVDEERKRNLLRLDYPEGSRYTDVSTPTWRGEPAFTRHVPFADADSLQPVTIPEYGRNQRFLVTFAIPKGTRAGVYRGTIAFAGAGTMPVELTVLPIELPVIGSPYWNTAKSFIALENSTPIPCGRNLAEREKSLRTILKAVRAHQILHSASLWDSPEYVKMATEAGFPKPDRIFSKRVEWIPDWRSFYGSRPLAALDEADRERGERVAARQMHPGAEYFARMFPYRPEIHSLFFSENRNYNALVLVQEGQASVAHRLGFRVFAHTMTDGGEMYIAGDIQDMVSDVRVNPAQARVWHEAGGEIINYANPFPSSENPEYFRRKVGLVLYKSDYDGDMMHECIHYENPFNEFGDGGGYRNFNMGFPSRGGVIWKLAYDGLREAHNDVRYLTALKTRAERLRTDSRDAARREAKRQLLWLAALDGSTADLDMVRASCAERIMVLDGYLRR